MRAVGLPPFGGRKPRRSALSVRRVGPILLFIILVAYGTWFAHVLRSHATAADAAGAADGDDGQPALIAGWRATATSSDEQLEAAVRSSRVEVIAAALLAPKPRALGAEPYARPAEHCNYTAGAPASGNAAYFVTALDAVPLPSCALAGRTIDHEALTISAWVYVNADASSIQTVLANKAAGCEPSRAHHGFALFVNEWETRSQQAWLSWGNDLSGCEELGSEHGSVPLATWTHLAASFEPTDRGGRAHEREALRQRRARRSDGGAVPRTWPRVPQIWQRRRPKTAAGAMTPCGRSRGARAAAAPTERAAQRSRAAVAPRLPCGCRRRSSRAGRRQWLHRAARRPDARLPRRDGRGGGVEGRSRRAAHRLSRRGVHVAGRGERDARRHALDTRAV